MTGIWIGASLLAVAAIGGVVWGFRALAVWRLNAAADAYVKREIDRTQRVRRA